MTRRELIRMLIARARAQGFEFRRWYQGNIEPVWKDLDQAIATLEHGRRYYALLFSHDFARNFWKKGAQITFVLPSREYTRLDRNGQAVTVRRRAFTRRTSRSTSNSIWQYHLEQMALWEEPLRYIRRFVLTEEELEAAENPLAAEASERVSSAKPTPPEPGARRGLSRRPVNWC